MKNTLAIYDLGIGGLGLIDPIRNFLPELAIDYYCDVEGFVYDSTMSFIKIQERTKRVCQTIFEQKSNLIVLAAHTLTMTSLTELQRWVKTEYPDSGKMIIGINLPLKQLLFDPCWELRNQPGLFLMSHAAIRTGYYQQECLKNGFNNAIFVPADKLNNAIEFGDFGSIDFALKEILTPFTGIMDQVSYVVPTSTHFDILGDRVKRLFSSDVKIVETNKSMASNLVNYINKHPEYKVESGEINYYTTGKINEVQEKLMRYYNIEHEVSEVVISETV
jgi:glutamate racemase